MPLNAVQLRVLGSLIEKEITTPEAYPLSLNALLNACNQKSSRDPVMELDEESVRQALHGLAEMGLVTVSRDSRVARFEHTARTVYNLRRDETALLCLLLLRGPQTTGELRSRSDRLYAFDDLQSVESTLERLASRTSEGGSAGNSGPLVVLLSRQAGAREARWTHLLGGDPASSQSPIATSPTRAAAERAPSDADARISALEAEVASFRGAIFSLEQKLERHLQQSEPNAGVKAAATAS